MIFDEKRLLRILEEAPDGVPQAFAAACAGRLERPAAEAWSRAADLIGGVLDALHDHLVSGKPLDCEAAEEPLLDSLPGEDEEPGFGAAVGEDALAAAVFALRALREEPVRNAAWAAMRAYDTVDRWVGGLIGGMEYTPAAERFIAGHPLTVQELERQQRDLRELGSALASRDRARLSQILARSRTESCLAIEP